MTENGIDRRQLLKLAGAGGVALVGAGVAGGGWSRIAAFASPEEAAAASGTGLACVLSPAKTEGPYFVDEKLNRSDIRTDPSDNSVQSGVPLQLTIRAFDSDRGCAPVKGATIDVWHCNAAGSYSDVAQNGTSGKKYLRGFQMTDSTGAVKFTTIYPGWYQGRTVHIHFKVRLFDGVERDVRVHLADLLRRGDEQHRPRPARLQPRPHARHAERERQRLRQRRGAAPRRTRTAARAPGYAATFDVGLSGLPAGASSDRLEARRVAHGGRLRPHREAAGGASP